MEDLSQTGTIWFCSVTKDAAKHSVIEGQPGQRIIQYQISVVPMLR